MKNGPEIVNFRPVLELPVGFVRAAAIELPKELRINAVSPTVLKESEAQYGPFFPGIIPVEGWKVGQALSGTACSFDRLMEHVLHHWRGK
jgi:hypothetical protein